MHLYCKFLVITTGSTAGDRANTIGNANDEITKPIVIKIASSRQGLLNPPLLTV